MGKSNLFVGFLLGSILCIVTSCSTSKAIYFNDLDDSTLPSNTQVPESVIQNNDLLSIAVGSLNAEASAIFNPPSNAGSAAGSGYLVGSDGNIQFPVLGNIKATGLTKEQLKANITRLLVDKKLLVDPLVNIRFLNFRVTVLGEVKNPGVLQIPTEKVSLLEAIGLSGDLTLYARRDNVLVIRDDNGVKKAKRLNLNSKDELFTSPYYYLKSGDVVYAEPSRSHVASSGNAQMWIPIAFSALSLGIIIIDHIKF
jgi:polysaccharide export outer membrane protein